MLPWIQDGAGTLLALRTGTIYPRMWGLDSLLDTPDGTAASPLTLLEI